MKASFPLEDIRCGVLCEAVELGDLGKKEPKAHLMTELPARHLARGVW